MEEEINGFKDLRIVDNFYQTSSYFPMPTTEIGTLSESGRKDLTSYETAIINAKFCGNCSIEI